MKVTVLTFLLLTGFVIGPAHGEGKIDLKPTPVQSMLKASLALQSGNDDGFEQLDKKNDRKQDGFATIDSEYSGRKSVWKAGLYSALLPGLGEYYVGRKTKARYFFAVEAMSWVGYLSFHTYSNWKKNDLIKFAATNAGADLEGKDDNFLDMVGFYDDIDEYNTRGRVDDPDRPYYPDTEVYHWAWSSSDQRSAYRTLKNRSREATRRRDFMLGLAIVNRIVSVIDAVRDAGRSLRKIDGSFSGLAGVQYRVDIDPFDKRAPINLTLFKKF